VGGERVAEVLFETETDALMDNEKQTDLPVETETLEHGDILFKKKKEKIKL